MKCWLFGYGIASHASKRVARTPVNRTLSSTFYFWFNADTLKKIRDKSLWWGAQYYHAIYIYIYICGIVESYIYFTGSAQIWINKSNSGNNSRMQFFAQVWGRFFFAMRSLARNMGIAWYLTRRIPLVQFFLWSGLGNIHLWLRKQILTRWGRIESLHWCSNWSQPIWHFTKKKYLIHCRSD